MRFSASFPRAPWPLEPVRVFRGRGAIAPAVAFLLFVIATYAQDTTTRLDGTVSDQSGARIGEVAILLTNVETNVARTTATNDSGLFVFPLVPPGTYDVTGQLAGFKTATVRGVWIAVGKPTTVDLVLEVGDQNIEITVSATAGQPLLNTTTAENSVILTRQQLEALPQVGRRALQFVQLQPGITGSGDNPRNASVNGLRGSFNNLSLDGVNNQDNFFRNGTFFEIIPTRTNFVEEVAVSTSNSDRSSGLGAFQTRVVTRSGSNRFNGEIYYYHGNDALNANEFFNNSAGLSKPKLLDHKFGGSLGGPLIRNKLFFFLGLEKGIVPTSVPVTRTVLTESMRRGDFSYLRRDNGQLETANLFDLTGISPDPLMDSLIDLTPLPNDLSSSLGDGRNVGAFRFNSDASSETDWLALRIDYELSALHTLTGTFHQFRFSEQNDPFNGIDSVFPGLPGGGQKSTRRLGSVAWLSSFTPSLSNEVRFGIQHAPVDFFTSETFESGYQVAFNTPLISNPVQNFVPNGRNAPLVEIRENANWLAGNHTVTFGGSLRRMEVDSFNDWQILPRYFLGFNGNNRDPLRPALFPGGILGSDLSNASQILQVLGGVVDRARQVFNVTSKTSGFVDGATDKRLLQQSFFSLHGGDIWRITRELSLSFGLRWEYHTVPHEANGLALLPVGGPSAVLDREAVIDFAGPDTAQPFFGNDWNNLAPKIGLAWRIFDQTVIRAGYAINYVIDSNMTVVDNVLRANAGLSQRQVVPGLSGTVSDGGLAPVPVPEFKVPRTARDQILADPTSPLFAIDPNFRVPYVQQWSFGIQHQLVRNLMIEARYVGNRGTKLGRGVDLNQVSFPEEFVQDFKRAQRNLIDNGDPAVGEPLTFIPNLGDGGALGAGFVQNWILNGEIGQYVGGFLAPNRSFFFAGEGGERFGSTVPIDLFYPNPNTFAGDLAGNDASSTYHALQLELRRPFGEGFSTQVNYTFGKALTDFSGTSVNFRGLFDNKQPSLEKMRPDYDITHTFNANFIYSLPFGPGQRFLSRNGWAHTILGGWRLSGIARIHSGETINLISGRGTINRGGSRALTNSAILSNISIGELQDRTGAFRDEEGRVVLFDPSLMGPDGRASPEFFSNPGLLEAGTLGLSPVSGPWYATFDFGLRKSFPLPLTEDSRVEVRVDVFNSLNRANFNIGTTPASGGGDGLGVRNRHNINATDFGVINRTFGPRQVRVGMRISF